MRKHGYLYCSFRGGLCWWKVIIKSMGDLGEYLVTHISTLAYTQLKPIQIAAIPSFFWAAQGAYGTSLVIADFTFSQHAAWDGQPLCRTPGQYTGMTLPSRWFQPLYPTAALPRRPEPERESERRLLLYA